MSTNNVVEEIFTPTELAARLRVDVSTVFRLIKEGRFETVYQLRGRRTTRIPASAVNKYLKQQTVTEKA